MIKKYGTLVLFGVLFTLGHPASALAANERFWVGLGYGYGLLNAVVPAGTGVASPTTGGTTETYKKTTNAFFLEGAWRASPGFGLSLHIGTSDLASNTVYSIKEETYVGWASICPRAFFGQSGAVQFGFHIGSASVRYRLDGFFFTASTTVKSYLFLGPTLSLNLRFTDLISMGADATAYYIASGFSFGFYGMGTLRFWFG